MTKEELKQIPITRLLSYFGYEPMRKYKGNTQWMYRSPLREDTKPSFSVSIRKNLWNDLGTGEGGNIIDLAIKLNGNCTFHRAATWLEENFGEFMKEEENEVVRHQTFLNPKRPEASEFRDVEVIPLQHHALLSYLLKRRIPLEIGMKYCREVHYEVYFKEYFGLCFLNIVGGMEIRNPYFKGCYGEKAPSVIPIEKGRHTESCCVFEGFMDMLSYYAFQKDDPCSAIVQREPCDCIVLNSTALVAKTIPFIDVYTHACCYLDNDEAGRAAFAKLSDAMPGKCTSFSFLYEEYNDLNDYLLGKMKRNPTM